MSSKDLTLTPRPSLRHQLFEFLYKWGMVLTVILLIAAFGLASDSFLDPNNIINILRSIAIVTVIAVGVSISLTVGGFDLSVGSTASLANALVISLFVWYGFSTTEAIVVTLLLCTLVGLFNSLLIVVLRIPDMLATLATLFVVQGVAMTYSYGGSITENMVLPSGDMAEGAIPAAFGLLGRADHRDYYAGGDAGGAAGAVADQTWPPHVRAGRQRRSGASLRHPHRALPRAGLRAGVAAGRAGRHSAGVAHRLFAGQRRRRLSDGCRGGRPDRLRWRARANPTRSAHC